MDDVAPHIQGESQDALDRGGPFIDQSLELMEQFSLSGHDMHINAAVNAASLAIRNTPSGHVEMPPRLSNLSVMLELRYKHFKDTEDLKNSIIRLEEAIDLLPKTQADVHLWLLYLGNSQGSLFDKTGEDEDLRSCIATYRKLLGFSIEDPDIRRDACYKISDRLAQRYENMNQEMDLNDAVDFARQLLPPIDDFNNDFDPADASYLIRRLGLRYERFGLPNDLDEAISLATRALNTVSEDDSNWPAYATNLGQLLEQRYAAKDSQQDLLRAIEFSRLAVNFPHLTPQWRSVCASNLGSKLMSLFEKTGSLELAQESIRMGRLANELWLQISGTYNLKSCLNLGASLARFYQYAGQFDYLEDAIKLLSTALSVCPETSHYYSILLDSMAGMLYMRYEQGGELEDLDRSILIARQILASMDKGHGPYFKMRRTLSRNIGKRFERIPILESLNEAIELDDQDLNLTRRDEGLCPQTIRILVNLSHHLRLSYQTSGTVAHLERAIVLGEEAVELTKSQTAWIDCLTTLANNYGYLYKHSNDIRHLMKAISISQLALDRGYLKGRSSAMLLNNVAYKYEQLYPQIDNEKCLVRACNLFKRAWYSDLSIPFHRVMAASRCLKLLTRLGRHEEATELAHNMVDFMSTFDINTLNYADRQYVVSTFSGVAAEACASFLELGQAEPAIVFLEQGRTMILNGLLKIKEDLSELRAQRPDIVDKYETLRSQIANPLEGDGTDPTRQKTLEQRRLTVSEIKGLTAEIQGLEGWSNFLASPTIETIKACARDGAIVVINVTSTRSDALLITSSNISVVKLPDMGAEESERWTAVRWDGKRQSVPAMNKHYRDYLLWLWNVCAKPVTERVADLCPQRSEALPRIWWIGVGICSSMPFHAAGDHSAGSTNNTLAHGISSYSPSIEVLAHAQRRLSNARPQARSLLLTTMSKTPGARDLSNALQEKDRIIECTQGLLSCTWKDQPSADFVFDNLQYFTAVHFACHGLTNKYDPSNSGIVFKSSSDEGSPSAEVLTVHRLSSMGSHHADMAYLSSCSTAENKIVQLSDEAIHVASAFQVAGFRHVVACLWPTYDEICADVAGDFYVSAFGGSGENVEERDVAEALHKAILKQKSHRPRNPLSWAQFVHFGA